MDFLKERVAYLKGLAEGLEIKEDSKEGKVLVNMIDVLDEFADALKDISDVQDEMSEYVDEIDEDLTDLEDDFYDEEYYEDQEELEGQYYEVQCPNCQETIVVDEDVFLQDNTVECPNCETEIEFEIEDDCCSECDCEKHETNE